MKAWIPSVLGRMSVNVSEFPSSGSHTPINMADQPEHKEELLADARRNSYLPDKLRHTAAGLQAIGFNEHASMYRHGYRNYSADSESASERRARMRVEEGEKKQRPGLGDKGRTMSFIKKLIGGKEKEGEKDGGVKQ